MSSNQKKFQELQASHLDKYSKSTRLSTSQVVYTSFISNHGHQKVVGKPPQHESCDYILMLERVYHPDCLQLYNLKEGYERKDEGENQENVIEEQSEDEEEGLLDESKLEEKAQRQKLEHVSLKGERNQKIADVRSPRDRSGQFFRFPEETSATGRIENKQKIDIRPKNGRDQLSENGEVASIEEVKWETGSGRLQNLYLKDPHNDIDDQIRKGTFIDELEQTEKEKTCDNTTTKLKYEHTKLKNRYIESGGANQNNNQGGGVKSSHKNHIDIDKESDKLQFRRMQGMNSTQMKKMLQLQEDNETHKYQLMGKSRKMGQVRGDIKDQKTHYTISMWRMHQGHLPLMISSLEITSQNDFSIYNDQLYYSHDGQFIFFLVLNKEGYVDKAVVAYSDHLQQPETHEISLIDHKIHGIDIENDPALLWGHKDSFESDYIGRQTTVKSSTDFGSSNQLYILYIQHSRKASFFRDSQCAVTLNLDQFVYEDGLCQPPTEYNILKIFFDQKCKQEQSVVNGIPQRMFKDKLFKSITLIVKKNLDGPNNQLSIFKTNLLKIRDRVNRNGGNFSFTDEYFTFHQQITHADFVCDKSRMQIYADHGVNSIIIVADSVGNTDNSDEYVSQVITENDEGIVDYQKSLLYLQLNPIQPDSGNSQIKNQDNEYGNIVFSTDAEKYYFSAPIALITSRDPVFQKHYHLSKNLRVILYNEKFQTNTLIKASDVFKQFDETGASYFEISEITQVKLDSELDPIDQDLNCFDFSQDQFSRVYTILEGENQSLQKLRFSIFDDDEEQSIAQTFAIDRLDFLFINPFIVQAKNNYELTIISIYDCSRRCAYKLDNYFLCFAEMQEGSLRINGEIYYRCSTLLYLTLDENNKVRLNLMRLPAYVECNKRLDAKERNIKLQTVKYEYALDFLSLKKEKVIKSFIGTIQIPGKPDALIAVFQFKNDIIVESFNAKQYNATFSTGGSIIPMLQNCVLIKTALKSIHIFIHTNDVGHKQQKLNLLTLQANELPKMTPICDFKQQNLLALTKFEDTLITLDDTFCVKRYKYSSRLGELKIYQESELVEGVQTILKLYPQDVIPKFIAMCDTEVYIGSRFFQNYSNLQTNKDANSLFEKSRNKRIGDLKFKSLLRGPISSIDYSYLLYVKVVETQDEGGRKKVASKREMTPASNNFNSSLKLVKQDNPLGSENLGFTALSLNAKMSLVRKGKMPACNEIYCIPYLGSRSIQLLHKDDYLLEKVQFSTFTLKDHIMVMINWKLFIFNSCGSPVLVDMSVEDEDLISREDVEIVRIQSNKTMGNQVFLFCDKQKYYSFILTFKHGKGDQKDYYVFQKSKELTRLESSHTNESHYYQDAKQDSNGDIYQCLVELDESKAHYTIQIQLNDERQLSIEQAVRELLSEYVKDDTQSKNGPTDVEAPKLGFEQISQVDTPRIAEELIDQEEMDLLSKIDIDFEILHCQYFVFKINLTVYYYDLIQKQALKEVNLKLRPGQITQLLQTQIPHLLQFVYLQQEPTKVTYIMTWNLKSNMEDQMLEVPLKCYESSKGISNENDAVKVIKGVTERLNYYVPSKMKSFYDLRFNFPFNYFNGVSACLKIMSDRQNGSGNQRRFQRGKNQGEIKKKVTCINELKMSANAIHALGITRECYATLYQSCSYIDYQYMEHLFENNMQAISGEEEDNKQAIIIMVFLKFRLDDGSNILHILPTNERFLTLYARVIKILCEECDYPEAESFYFNIVCPNNNGITPLDLAIQERASRSIELMIDMISQRPQYNFSKYLQKHLYTLLEMRSSTFEQFLESCTFKISMSLKHAWEFQKDSRQFAYHTAYLDDGFIKQSFSVGQDELKLSSRNITAKIADNYADLIEECTDGACNFNANANDLRGFEYEIEGKNIFDEKKKQTTQIENETIFFEAIEFPWVFHGQTAKSFIAYLDSKSESSRLFSNLVIQNIIMFQWRHFVKAFIIFRYIPFLIYFGLIIIFTTLTHQYDTFDNPGEDKTMVGWNLSSRILGILIIVWTAYFAQLEVMKLFKSGLSFAMFQEWILILLTLSLVIVNFSGASDTNFRLIGVFVLAEGYFHFIMYLKLFDSTAVLVSMIYYICKAIIVFVTVFIVAVVAFANMFFIMQGVAVNLGSSSDEAQIVGGDFMTACISTFRAAFGNFDTTNFINYGPHEWILWVIYLTLIMLLSLVMLNMIIAIMGDTYDQVMQIQKEERFKAKCRFIHENEFIFARYRLFKNYRYIIIASLDKIEDQGDDWEGKINALKNHMDQKFNDNSERQGIQYKTMATQERKIISAIKNQDHHMSEISNQLFKIQSQIEGMESKKKMDSILARSGTKIRERISQHFLLSKIQDQIKVTSGVKQAPSSPEKQNNDIKSNPLAMFLANPKKLSAAAAKISKD